MEGPWSFCHSGTEADRVYFIVSGISSVRRYYLQPKALDVGIDDDRKFQINKQILSVPEYTLQTVELKFMLVQLMSMMPPLLLYKKLPPAK